MKSENERDFGSKLARILISVFMADIAILSIALTAKLVQWMLF